MVSLSETQASNARIASTLPPGLVAIFVGGTNGIGEMTLRCFAKHTREPRIYNVGRSHNAGDRIGEECRALNPKVEYIFIKADTSLMRNVDEVCRQIKGKEKTVNVLFLSVGSLAFGKETSEGLEYIGALTIHGRSRFILNLLPLLQDATSLRRVVSVFAATKEGPADTDDFTGKKLPFRAIRGHAASLVTCSLEALAKKAPDISFVHDFPSFVRSGISREIPGLVKPFLTISTWVTDSLKPGRYVPNDEVGERHVYFATSARYPAAAAGGVAADGVPLVDGNGPARGTTGSLGSGVYSIDWDGESAGPAVEKLLTRFREDGSVEKIWKHIVDDFVRITGMETI